EPGDAIAPTDGGGYAGPRPQVRDGRPAAGYVSARRQRGRSRDVLPVYLRSAGPLFVRSPDFPALQEQGRILLYGPIAATVDGGGCRAQRQRLLAHFRFDGAGHAAEDAR